MLVLSAIVVVAIGFGVGYAVGDDGHGADDQHGLANDRMAVMMADGSMPEMMKDFTAMMTQLQGSMTPEMRQQMDADAMWKLMESGELQQMMNEHGATMGQMPGMHSSGGDHQGPGNHGSG
ncbi:MAG: hypothetical protein WEC34_03025 [Acidimicrobiia bacterium]